MLTHSGTQGSDAASLPSATAPRSQRQEFKERADESLNKLEHKLRRGWTKTLHKFEGAALGMGQGVSSLANKLKDRDAPLFTASAVGPPQMLSAPSQATREPVGAIGLALGGPRGAAVGDLLLGNGEGGSAMTSTGVAGEGAVQGAQWWTPGRNGCDYLGICIREARGLPITDYDSRSTTSYVKVRLDAPAAATVELPPTPGLARPTHKPKIPPLAEAATRRVYRTRNPMWEQSFFFPMLDLTADTRLTMGVYGLASNMNLLDTTTFSGQVHTTLDYLLHHTHGTMQPFSAWYQLGQRRATDRVSGQLLVTVLVVPEEVHAMVAHSEDSATLLDPNVLHTLLHAYCLNIHLHEVRSLRLTTSESTLNLTNLSIQVRLGQVKLAHPLPPGALQPIDEAPSSPGAATSVSEHVPGIYRSSSANARPTQTYRLQGEVLVPCPLTTAFEVGSKWGKRKKERDEVGDIKIALLAGKEVIASTQVPIWDLPVCVEGEGLLPEGAESGWEASKPPAEACTQQRGEVELWRKRAFSSLVHSLNSSEEDDAREGGRSVNAAAAEAVAWADARRTSTGGAEDEAKSTVSDVDAPGVVPIVTGLAVMRAFMRRNPGPLGFRYRRMMESRGEEVVGFPEMDVSLSLVPYEPDASTASTVEACPGVMTKIDEEEGVRDLDDATEGAATGMGAGDAPTPVAMPPPLTVTVGEVSVPIRPLQAFDMLFKPDHPFRTKLLVKEELKDIVHGPWAPDPALTASSGHKGAQSRTVTYVRPLTIPIPMAPKEASVTEVQTLPYKEAGGWSCEAKISTSAPKGDAFFVLIQWAATADDKGGSRVRVSFKVEFVKSVGLLKGAIEGGAVSSTKAGTQQWLDELVRDAGSVADAVAMEESKAEAGQHAAAAKAETLATLATAATAAPPPPAPPNTLDLVFPALLLLVVVFALWYLIPEVRGLARALEALGQALVEQQRRQQAGEQRQRQLEELMMATARLLQRLHAANPRA